MPLPLAHPQHQRHGGRGCQDFQKDPPTPAPSPTGTTYGPLLSSSAPVLTARAEKDITQGLDWRHRPGRVSARTPKASAAAAQHPPVPPEPGWARMGRSEACTETARE